MLTGESMPAEKSVSCGTCAEHGCVPCTCGTKTEAGPNGRRLRARVIVSNSRRLHGAGKRVRKEIPMSTTETILDVEGMTCSSCVRHVEGALCTLDGVAKVEVALKNGTVRIEHDASRAPVARMIQALEEAGYDSRAAAAGV
jgi:copper chaperone